ncbi:MAG: hypothetical protein ACI9F9_001494 [Candidatus Paceibacteria bacterium]|jgi:hypothetical protein
MSQGQLLIAGMFRSGTTLLSRLLSDHPEGLVVSDPFVYFFKHYRNLHMRKLGLSDWHPDEPTPDYFGGARRKLFESLQAANLQETLPEETLQQLIADIRNWKSDQHPELCARLDELHADTFAAAYAALMDLAVDIYGHGETAVAGTKVSWCEEFLPAMARAFPHMRFVMPVRDIRAVVASQNNQRFEGEGKRPLLFYVRHWRKSVALAHHYSSTHPLLRGRVALVRYEDLVSAPESNLNCIMEHVGLAPRTLQVSAGRDGQTHNSSYETGAEGIFTGSTERWRQVLSEDEILAIEAMAGPELAMLGYRLGSSIPRPIECLELDCEPSFDSLSPWLKPFAAAAYVRDSRARKQEYRREEERREVLESSTQGPPQVERSLFLVDGMLPALRRTWGN